MNIKEGILNLKTRHLSNLGRVICPNAECLRCAVPRKKVASLEEALYSPAKLMTVEEMLNEDYMISLQQLKTDEFFVLTGLIFLDEFVVKVELTEHQLIGRTGFSFSQHRHNFNEAQLVINKVNFKSILNISEKIPYSVVEDLLQTKFGHTEQKAA